MSGTVVMKFGGTSVADAERIKRAARRIVSAREQGHRVVAVLSARGKTTDELISAAEEVSTNPDPREMDMLLSTGERISCALCAMAINDLGHRAISLTGSQAGIVTDTSHTKARILDVRADRIHQALDEDLIVLVAGFQGVSTARDVTTLGRGGSDTTAVALAAALDAEVCDIYTDVAGVYSADPRIVPDARKLPVVSFEEMLEMSASGAGVLQLRSVEYARNHGVRIHCRSSFTEAPGTLVVGEEETMERPLITAVTHSRDEARLTLLGVPDHPGVSGRIFTALAEANINVDMIIQDEPDDEGAEAHMSFTVPRTDLRQARAALDPVAAEVGIRAISENSEMGKVSVVGAGMKSHPGVAAKVFSTLGDQGINIEMISTSPIKISCVVTADGRGPRRARAARGVRPRGGPDRGRAPVRSTRMSQYKVAVVGATGAVGTVMLAKLKERGFPASEIVPFASERSAGKELEGFGTIRALNDEYDPGLRHRDLQRGRDHLPRVGAEVRRGRRGRRRQLVRVPPRPGDPARRLRGQPGGARRPQGPDRQPELLDDAADGRAQADLRRGRIDRLNVSTYQSVSGTGVKAVKELEDQTRAALNGEPLPDPTIYPHHIAFNVLGGAGNFPEGDDHTDEERKMMFETRKILGDESIKIAVTCARVPVRSSHSESVTLETREDLSVERPASCWRTCRGSSSSTTRPRTATRPRSAAPAATRCSSVACAAIPRTSAACSCGS